MKSFIIAIALTLVATVAQARGHQSCVYVSDGTNTSTCQPTPGYIHGGPTSTFTVTNDYFYVSPVGVITPSDIEVGAWCLGTNGDKIVVLPPTDVTYVTPNNYVTFTDTQCPNDANHVTEMVWCPAGQTPAINGNSGSTFVAVCN